ISSVLFSKYVDKIVRIATPAEEKEYVKSIIAAIRRFDIDLIIPVGFIDFILLSKYKKYIEKYAILPIEKYEKLSAISNKWFLRKIASDIGARYPKSLVVKNKIMPDIKNFIEEIGFPVVIKGIGDASKPKFVSNYDELLEECHRRIRSDFLLQEYVPGTGVGYFVLSYMGEPIAEFMHKRLFESTPLGGASIKAETNFDPELLRLGRTIVRKTKWTGVMMAEFRKEEETGELYLIEVNPKFWGSLELAYRAGVDFPKYLADFFFEAKRPEQILIRSVSFSWIMSYLSFYSKYGLKILLEAVPIITPKSPLLSDFHLHDPPNFIINSLASFFLLFRSLKSKVSLENVYLTDELKNALFHTNLIVSDLDGTIVKLPVPWKKVSQQASLLSLTLPQKGINQSFAQYWLAGDYEAYSKLSNLVEEYEMEAVERVRVNKKLINAIKNLKKISIKFVIISKQSKRCIVACLERFGLLDCVDKVIGREDTPIRYEQLKMVIKDIENVQKPVMFGDTLVDLKASLKANMVPCRITSRNLEKIQAKELGVSYTDNILKILNLIFR
ncbi:MAG: HAD hydrolase-like protein, partial [Candidatus Baldrarchaeia archaeon]